MKTHCVMMLSMVIAVWFASQLPAASDNSPVYRYFVSVGYADHTKNSGADVTLKVGDISQTKHVEEWSVKFKAKDFDLIDGFSSETLDITVTQEGYTPYYYIGPCVPEDGFTPQKGPSGRSSHHALLYPEDRWEFQVFTPQGTPFNDCKAGIYPPGCSFIMIYNNQEDNIFRMYPRSIGTRKPEKIAIKSIRYPEKVLPFRFEDKGKIQRVALENGFRIRGRIIEDTTGKPVKTAHTSIKILDSNTPHLISLDPDSISYRRGHFLSRAFAATKIRLYIYDDLAISRQFILSPLDAGENWILINENEGLELGRYPTTPDEEGNRIIDIGDIPLHIDAFIGGMVVDSDFNPVKGAYIEVQRKVVRSKEDGRFFCAKLEYDEMDCLLRVVFNSCTYPAFGHFRILNQSSGHLWGFYGPYDTGRNDVIITAPLRQTLLFQARRPDGSFARKLGFFSEARIPVSISEDGNYSQELRDWSSRAHTGEIFPKEGNGKCMDWLDLDKAITLEHYRGTYLDYEANSREIAEKYGENTFVLSPFVNVCKLRMKMRDDRGYGAFYESDRLDPTKDIDCGVIDLLPLSGISFYLPSYAWEGCEYVYVDLNSENYRTSSADSNPVKFQPSDEKKHTISGIIPGRYRMDISPEGSTYESFKIPLEIPPGESEIELGEILPQ